MKIEFYFEKGGMEIKKSLKIILKAILFDFNFYHNYTVQQKNCTEGLKINTNIPQI